MGNKRENPAAQARADRVDVTVLAGKDDVNLGTGTQRERQARHILKFCAISLPLARVLAEHAFDPGRKRA